MRRLKLGKVLGIQIELDYSWFIIFALITWTLAEDYFPTDFPDWSLALYWIVGGVTAVLFFISVLLHELGHSVIALYHKIRVRRITLFIFGGAAQIDDQPPSARAEFLIAIAGPIVSVALGGALILTTLLLPTNSISFGVARYLAFINIALAVFNMAPGFPLDGGRVLRSVVWYFTDNLNQATAIAANIGRFIGYAFMTLGFFQFLVGAIGSGLWIMFIGWFLNRAAVAEMTQQIARNLLSDSTAAEIMRKDIPVVPPNATLAEIIDTYILAGNQDRTMIVEDQNDNLSMLVFSEVKKVPSEEWNITLAADIATPLDDMKQVRPNTILWNAFKMMQENNLRQMPVFEQGFGVIGILMQTDIIEFMRLRRELST